MMKISAKITQQIQCFPEGTSFGYSELAIDRKDFLSAAKTLERLQKKGLIRKLAKGKFYKPKRTPFGEKKPDEEQVIKPYLYQQGKRIAYITGEYLYNQLGLTTQVPAVLKIASRGRRISINLSAIKATAVKSYAEVTEENYQLLGFLDALKDLKHIPDLDIKNALIIINNRLKQLTEPQRRSMIDYALAYPPRVRALLGAMFTGLKQKKGVEKLQESLNPLTTFDLGINNALLPTASDWSIR